MKRKALSIFVVLAASVASFTLFALFAGQKLSARDASKNADAAPFDIVIRDGRILDGTGSPWYSGDVAIRDGRIAAIGRLGKVPAKRVDRCASARDCAGFH